jgi:hypothetical protein
MWCGISGKTTHLAEVLGLRDALHIEKLGDGLQTGKALGDRLTAHRIEAARQVEAAGERIERDVDASHGDRQGSKGRKELARGLDAALEI